MLETGPDIVAFHTDVSACGVLKLALQLLTGDVPLFVMVKYAVYPPDQALVVQLAVIFALAVAVVPIATAIATAKRIERDFSLEENSQFVLLFFGDFDLCVYVVFIVKYITTNFTFFKV